MIFFVHPAYLWLLFLVPLLPVLYGFAMHLRRRRVEQFGDPEMVEALAPGRSKAKGWVRIVLLSLALGCLAVGLSRPRVGARLSERQTKGAEIMICLDVSNSMLARDYSPSRLERAKLAIFRLTDKLRDDRIGLIVFAGKAFVQLPITADYVSAKMFLGSIDTGSVPVQGTAIGDAIMLAAKSFSAQSEKSRAIIVITDGENHEDDPVEAAKQAAELGCKVYTVGVGSPQGQPIPVDGELLKDKEGNIVVTKLDEKTLREVAAAGGGAYVRAGNEEFGLNPIIEDIRRMEAEQFKSVVFEEYDEQFMYFFAAALILLVIELLIGYRRHLRSLFDTRKLSVIAIALVLLPLSASAQVDKKDVRAGNRKFRKGDFPAAELCYRKALIKDTSSLAAKYNLASALYRQEDWDGASKALEGAANSAAMSAYGADYFHNLGNVALQKGDYQTAVNAYQQSLVRRPGDFETKENYTYALRMLQQQGGGGGGGDSDQDQNDQNQDRNQNQNGQNDQNQDQDQNQNNNNDQNDQNQDRNDQNDQNDQNDRNDQNNPQNKPDEGENDEQKISPQQARRMLDAVQAKEKETQDKVNKKKAALLQSQQKEKNW